MIHRKRYLNQIKQLITVTPACAMLGPRQCGKTTLAHEYASHAQPVTFFDLEDITDLEKLHTPRLALEHLDGLIVIDEIQRRPDLFPYLRVLIDRFPDRKYLMLGSASRDLLQQSAETLAGRISYLQITPFQCQETKDMHKLLIRGGFPRSFLAASDEISWKWRKQYIQTYLEYDLPGLGVSMPPVELRRFWMILAHYHGQTINYSEIARIMGISDQTVRRYIAILEGTFMVRQLSPWFENLKKRQTKTPKFYIRDSGILLSLLNLSATDLLAHPKVGAIWEGFALEAIVQQKGLDAASCFFWNAPLVGEVDLLLMEGLKHTAFEFKYTDKPILTKNMLAVLEALHFDKMTIIVPIKADYFLHEKVHVMGLENWLDLPENF